MVMRDMGLDFTDEVFAAIKTRLRKNEPAWSTTVEGRFTGKDGAAGLVQRIETTLNTAHDSEPGRTIKEIWETDLARGPRRT